MNLHNEWYKHPTGKIPKGTICECCGRFNARDVVCIVVAIQADQVVLVKRAIEPMKGWWALPGGYLHWDETVSQGALRELREETGLKAASVQLVSVYSKDLKHNDGRQNIVLAFRTQVVGRARALDETEQVAWFSPDNLPERIAFGHEEVIYEVSKNQSINVA